MTSHRASARYQLTGTSADQAGKHGSTFRLIDAETGRHLAGAPVRRRASRRRPRRSSRRAKSWRALQPCVASCGDRSRPPRAGGRVEPARSGAAGDAARFCRSTPRVMRARSISGARDGPRSRHALATALRRGPMASGWSIISRPTPLEDRARGTALAHAPRPSAATPPSLPCSATPSPFCTTSMPRNMVVRKALSVDGGFGAGRGAAAGGSTSTAAMPTSGHRAARKIALDLAPMSRLAFNSMVGIGCAHFGAVQR